MSGFRVYRGGACFKVPMLRRAYRKTVEQFPLYLFAAIISFLIVRHIGFHVNAFSLIGVIVGNFIGLFILNVIKTKRNKKLSGNDDGNS